MKVFPSNNEKIITSSIVVFFTGAFLGLFLSTSITDQSILISAIATLAAAFLGAGAAYKLEGNKREREYEEECLRYGNNVMFALYERMQTLRLVQSQSINPKRDDPFKMISMLPIINLRYPDSEFNIESLMFILGTKHKQLILDLQIEKESFNVAFDMIKYRSDLHYHHVQPAVEAGGMKEGGEYTRQQVIDTLGERIYSQLERATNDLIENVDKTIESSEITKTRLVNALRDIFPNRTVLDFKLRASL
ncbi:MAG: hypothetical protein N0E58_08505 [Candidatus Thiodiazotropha endolucinida]|uniref:Uncharacterized protein n=1 Tax=Candidatus Thiodiazotropha taylori TaxID=2792791 RepID=A0A9E4NJV7_9GAMM|nr:hypothetical protein [Candidatus Thiodiazotropha taylori]MCW4236293.1 hypothetical protein [Candidatus Thiodiazotropha endolucinida]